MSLDPESRSRVLRGVRRTAGGRELASYASHFELSPGRLIDEPDSLTRTGFQRDRDRVLHSDAFRRLKHKTQVFVHHEDDHFRTRLTHTIEVGQIARALARALKLDEDLAEAIALVHDFGHPPFGHAGERVLDEKMKDFGGFDHNVQSLRVVTKLERRYAAFDGLNLTWETLEGLIKHNGPMTGDNNGSGEGVPKFVQNVDSQVNLRLETWASLEAQCAAVADDIAYNNHDLDDGLRACLFDMEQLREVKLCNNIISEVEEAYPNLVRDRFHHEIVRRQTTLMVEDVIVEALARINDCKINDVESVRTAGKPIVVFSEAVNNQEQELKSFLFKNMYRNPIVMRSVTNAESIISDLFDRYWEKPETFGNKLNISDDSKRARAISDYLAGMTDRFALSEHLRLFDQTPELR